MRAIAVTCPHCGASLRVTTDAGTVSCQYCGKPARIQQRSRILQVPRPLPPGPAGPPVARQRVSAAAYLPLLIVPVALGVGFLTMRAARSRVGPAAGRAQVTWAGGVPLVADVDGDGRDDAIGLIRFMHDGDHIHLAAWSAATGVPVWTSASLGKFGELKEPLLALTPGRVVLATGDGQLRGFARATGASLASVALSERVAEVCAAADAPAIAVTADDQWWALDDDGPPRAIAPRRRFSRPQAFRDRVVDEFLALGGEVPPDLCLASDNRPWRYPVGLVSLDQLTMLPTLPGMTARQLSRRPGGPVIAVGYKRPGTAVPMLGRYEAGALMWSVEVPAAAPLTASADEKHVALSATAVFAAYRGGDRVTRVTAFALADGARLWDTPVVEDGGRDASVVGLIVSDQTLLVATSYTLRGVDLATGAVRWQRGRW